MTVTLGAWMLPVAGAWLICLWCAHGEYDKAARGSWVGAAVLLTVYAFAVRFLP